jgi:putative DNA primase/helicase
MGYYKKFSVFCLEAARQLGKGFAPESEPKLHRAFRRYEEGLPCRYVLKASSASAERETVTCPNCDREAEVTKGGWHCFYCGGGSGSGGIAEDFDLDPDLPDSEHAPEVRRRLRAFDSEETLELAIKLFSEADRLGGSIGEVYLKARGLDPPPDCDTVMRWHPRCPFGSQREQCLVSLMRSALTDEVTALHRTHVISAASGLAERKVLGRLSGSAVKLWPLGKSHKLAVGEGIETVLAAVKLRIAEPPAWATTVANNLTRLPVIPAIKQLTILADNDASKTGEQAATALYHTYNRVGLDAAIKMPRVAGTDFNDLLKMERGHE